MRYLFVLYFLFVLCILASGHGDIHARIESLTAEIKAQPGRLELVQERGELRLLHRDYRAALRDFRRCEKEGSSERLLFVMAKAFHELGSFRKCEKYLQRIYDPDLFNLRTYHLSAHNFESKKEFYKAAQIYQTIIDSSLFVRPRSYLDLFNLYRLQKKPEFAISVLKNAIKEKGYLPVFYQPLVNLYEQTKDYEAAIYVMDRVIELTKRKEFSLYKRALLYQMMGNENSCKKDLEEALLLIQNLPLHIQNQAAVRNIRSEIISRSDFLEVDQS